MSKFLVAQLKGDRLRLLDVLDQTREAYDVMCRERSEEVEQLRSKLVAANNQLDPLTLKIERLETAAKRRKAKP